MSVTKEQHESMLSLRQFETKKRLTSTIESMIPQTIRARRMGDRR